VPRRIKPLPKKERRIVDLVPGTRYYVSFGTNNAYPCTLVEILEEFSIREIRVVIDYKPNRQGWYRNSTGALVWVTGNEHILFPSEIGETPEHAVQNEVR